MSKPKYSICVSGAAKGESVVFAHKLAKVVGEQIIHQGHLLLTGATTGLPYYAAKAAKSLHEPFVTSIGFSPASSRIEHVNKYRLPIDAYDNLIYTGFGYSGRDLLLIRASDAVIMIGGRIGTLNELTVALEDKVPVGVLLGSGGMTDEVEHVLKAAKRNRSGLVFDHDPEQLIKRVIEMVEHRNRKLS